MKCNIPEISWHNREPVLSLDIHPAEKDFYRLATGGADYCILIWHLKINETGAVDIDILSELTRHQRAVNAVRWSPTGEHLASADDDANIIIWNLKTDNIPLLEGESNYKETYVVFKILRGHKEDIYDLCWSPDGTKLFSGSIDNTAMLWDLNKGKNEHIITDHKGFVQGVTWDPKNQYLATLCSDRFCRVFDKNGQKVKARIGKGILPVNESHQLHNKDVKYFHDDTFKTFFRRLNFSPEGSFLIVPSGCVETEDSKNAMYATYLFTLDSLKQPAAILPTKQCSIVAKCCPVLFELWPNGPKPIIDLPYRMVIAIATDSDIVLYDTQQPAPFAYLQKIHYTRLTDLTWSNDGLLLTASSTDGFITLVTFDDGELGIKYEKVEAEKVEIEETPSFMDEEMPEVVEEKPTEIKTKKSNFIEEWAKKGAKRKVVNDENQSKKLKAESDIIEILESPVKNKPEDNNSKIVPISVSDTAKKIPISNDALKNSNLQNIETNKTKRIVPTLVQSKESESNLQNIETNKTKRIVPTLVQSKESENKCEATKGKRITPVLISENSSSKELNNSKPKRIMPIPILDKASDCPSVQNIGTDKAKRVTPILIQNSVTENPSVKKRIVPIKIAECSSATTRNDYNEDLMLLSTITDSDSSSSEIFKETIPKKPNVNNVSITQLANAVNIVQENKEDVSKNKQETGKTEAPSEKVIKLVNEIGRTKTPDIKKNVVTNKTPKSGNKKLNQSADKKSPANRSSSNKKKPKDVVQPSSSKMSLLQFFKPVAKDDHEENRLKLKPTDLFKSEKKKNEGKVEVIDLCEEWSDIPDDFHLQVEDTNDSVAFNPAIKEKVASVEITDAVQDKVVEQLKSEEVKQPRRIPLITLASPKNKKKKVDT